MHADDRGAIVVRRRGGDNVSSIQSTTQRSLEVGRLTVWPAYLLAVLCPGAGHWSRGQWVRGGSWTALWALSIVFFGPGVALGDVVFADLLVTGLFRHEVLAFGDVAISLAVLAVSVLDLSARIALEIE